MARVNTVIRLIAPAIVVGAVLCGLIPLLVFALREQQTITLDRTIWTVLRFTILQAALSTFLAVVPAVFVARALVRRNFSGKGAVLALFAVPQSLPVIVAVLGITQIYGRNGWLGGLFDLYGLSGILIAHIFFNLPLAVRILHDAIGGILPETHRLAAQLQLTGLAFFRTVEWPVLRPAILSASTLIFLLCAASFVIVLTLGGGPAATTLEVAIYQSLRLDFDLARAVGLALVQIALCAILIVGLSSVPTLLVQPPLRRDVRRYDGRTFGSRMFDILSIAAAVVCVLPPLVAITYSGLTGFSYADALPQALVASAMIGCGSATIAVVLAWLLSTSSLRSGPAVSMAGIIVPPAVIATGWFILFKGWQGGASQAVVMIVALNALMALPFASAILTPAITRSRMAHNKLCAQLGLSGWNRLTLIDLPALRPPLMQAILLAFVLSLGDLTAVTLLGSQGIVTLPSLIAQQMGNYRGAAAGGTALVLAAMCYSLTLLAQKLGRA